MGPVWWNLAINEHGVDGRTDLADGADGDVESQPVLETGAGARRQQVVDGRGAVCGVRRQRERETGRTGLRQQQTVVDVRLTATPELSLQRSQSSAVAIGSITAKPT